jgi:hypothetical protein
MLSKNRVINKNFYDEYAYFDSVLAEHFGVEENGVDEYIKRMKHAVIDVRDVLPEWDSTIARLEKMKARYLGLNTFEDSFDDYQGKDEDVVWMLIFYEKMDQDADPLAKYSKLEFTYKKRKKSLMQRLKELFG